jgi:hypothetical protein
MLVILNFILEAPGFNFDLIGFSRFSLTFPTNIRTELSVTLPGSSLQPMQISHSYHSTPSYLCMLASHRGGPGSNPDLIMWNLWWTKCHRDRFSPVSPANLHSTNFSTITITYHPGLVQ